MSEDNGLTWKNVEPEQWKIGEVAEPNSIDCDYGFSWEVVPNEYICREDGNVDGDGDGDGISWELVPNEYICKQV